ncbi:hypothetical protein Tco_1202548 [Tanacetum coccineum]
MKETQTTVSENPLLLRVTTDSGENKGKIGFSSSFGEGSMWKLEGVEYGESGRTLEGIFGEHCGGNGRLGGSMFGVGEGNDESMGGMGGGSLARRSMVSNDGRGGGGLVVAGGRSSSELRKA